MRRCGGYTWSDILDEECITTFMTIEMMCKEDEENEKRNKRASNKKR